MQPNPFFGLMYHWIGGLSAASCYLPFRGIRRWSWETYWFLQGCFAWIIAPALLSLALVPSTAAVLHAAPLRTVFYAFFWGAMWGVGGLLFGLGVRYLGIALGYTVALGFSTAFGTLVPPLFAGQMRAILADRAGRVTLLGVAVCLLAIVVSGFAGHAKERELSGSVAEDAVSPGGIGRFRFSRGLAVAILAGVFSACFAYGLAAARPVSDAARASLLSQGRSDLWQSLPALVLVLWGGWTTNALWCGSLFLRNRSARQFFDVSYGAQTISRSESSLLVRNYVFAAAAGLLWYGQFFFYSMGQARMKPYDFASWSVHMGGTILFATLWGVVLHEWRGTSRRTRSIAAAGVLLLLLSTVMVGYGNFLKHP